ncbi:putative extracellular phytase, partial [Neoconidiobolus thromboides FSU 785]
LLGLLANPALAIQRIKFSTCPGAACIMPVDGAEFLTGAQFDIRVEIHEESQNKANGDFELTVSKLGRNGVEEEPILVNNFFKPINSNPDLERWNFTYTKDSKDYYQSLDGDLSVERPVQVASKIWRNVHFKSSGKYIATIKYNNGETHKVEWIVRPAACKRIARNAILFIADGTTINMITAARVMARKQRNGKFPHKFEMDMTDYIGHVQTHSLDAMMTDSANSASAYHTGHKTAVNALGVYPDSSPNHFDDPKQELLAELARRRSKSRGGKMAIGIVTTAEVQDATPAAVFAHTRRRDDKAEIVDQLINGAKNASIPVIADVYLGGGGAYFHNKTGGKSLKGNDYYKTFEKLGYNIVNNGEQLRNYNEDKPLLGIFHKGNMDVFVDRSMLKDNLKGNKASPVGDNKDALDQPGLVDMTKKTLNILKKRGGDAGFFAMIEAASPDKQMHSMDFHRSLVEIIEFDNAIKAAVEWARKNDPSTLIVITADHGHGFDVYGTVDTEIFNNAPVDEQNLSKRNAIGVYESSGWPDYSPDANGYPAELNVRTVFAAATNNKPDNFENFQMNRTKSRKPAVDSHSKEHKYQVSVANKDFGKGGMFVGGNLPVENDQAVHSMTDVGIFASGPGAHLFGKVMDSTEVFFNFAYALGLGEVDPKECSKCPKKR